MCETIVTHTNRGLASTNNTHCPSACIQQQLQPLCISAQITILLLLAANIVDIWYFNICPIFLVHTFGEEATASDNKVWRTHLKSSAVISFWTHPLISTWATWLQWMMLLPILQSYGSAETAKTFTVGSVQTIFEKTSTLSLNYSLDCTQSAIKNDYLHMIRVRSPFIKP